MENGSFSKVLPVIPAQTPENWTTIATGANPGTHGIAIWGRHSYGESVTERHGDEAMSSNLCKAEYLWEAAARKGLGSVLHYFVGYPQTSKMAVHVDWFWRPGAYFFEICGNACYIYDPQGTSEAKRPREILVPIELSKAEDWTDLPENGSMALETEIRIVPRVNGEGVCYFALLLNIDNEGYRSCILSKEKDCSNAICSLREGEWSPWLKETFKVKGEKRIGTVRFKLVKLSKDAREMTLYRSQVYPVSGFTDPPEVAEELIEKFGPYINEAVDRPF